MSYSNIDQRNKVSIVLGLIFGTILRNYILKDVIDLADFDKYFIKGLFITIFDILTMVVMMLTVYYLYPIFKKNRA